MKKVVSERQAARIQAQVLAGRDYGPRVLEFLDGPLAGDFHEVESGWPCPCAVEMPLAGGGTAKYGVDAKTGKATLSRN